MGGAVSGGFLEEVGSVAGIGENKRSEQRLGNRTQREGHVRDQEMRGEHRMQANIHHALGLAGA